MSKSWWGGAIAWAVLIEALLLWPHPPALPQPIAFSGADKVVHLTLFGTQAFLMARALGARGRRLWWALLVTSAFGALTEIEQHFIPSRSMELGDWMADTLGAAIGLAVIAWWAQKRREQRV